MQGSHQMTDKEFKRLSRSQLIDIIYQLQLNEEKLLEENKKLKESLEDKRIRMEKAGSIAEAAIEINNVMQAAQSAADQYLKEIECMYEEMRKEVEEERQRIVKRTQEKAAAIITQTKRLCQYQEHDDRKK